MLLRPFLPSFVSFQSVELEQLCTSIAGRHNPQLGGRENEHNLFDTSSTMDGHSQWTDGRHSVEDHWYLVRRICAKDILIQDALHSVPAALEGAYFYTTSDCLPRTLESLSISVRHTRPTTAGTGDGTLVDICSISERFHTGKQLINMSKGKHPWWDRR